MTDVTIFLDVDGVVSPFPATSVDWGDWCDIRRRARLTPEPRTQVGFPCSLSKAMGDALASLDAELVWLTTWETLANDIICPYFGWPPLKVVDRSQHDEEPWWKLNAVFAHMESGGGRFIWVDDDIASNDYVRIPMDCPIPYLLVSPDTRRGLTPTHIEAMREFIG